MTSILFTKFTSVEPLSKTVGRAEDGSIVKKASAHFYAGSFDTIRVPANSEGIGQRLADALTGWTTHQALSPSLCLTLDAGRVVTQRVKAQREDPNTVARDTKHFGYRTGDVAAVLVLDYDPPKATQPMTAAELWSALQTLWPDVVSGVVVHWYSASSLIFDGDRQISGVGGQRYYIPIKSHADTPRALGVLNKRSWLKGIGAHVHVSASGSLLSRPLFDSAMGDAGGRLDFAPAGPILKDGLEQRRGLPSVLCDGQVIDTRQSLPDLSDAEEREVQALIEAAKLRAEPEAAVKRAAWLESRQQAAAIEAVKKGVNPDDAIARVKHEHAALLSGVLLGSAELIHVTDEGAEVIVTVDQLLADPKQWHKARFLSPHAPDHRGRSPDAMAFLLQSQPVLFDLNDSISYRLHRQPARLPVTAGNRAAIAEQIASVLASQPEIMQHARTVVRVVAGRFVPVNRSMMQFLIGTHIALFRETKEGKSVGLDPTAETADMVLNLLRERAREVIGTSSIPLIDSAGRIIALPGLDRDTGLYLTTGSDADAIPQSPTRTQTAEALKRLWRPWALYSWTTPHDRAAMLATVLTVPLRPTITSAPGLFVDAHSQGAGKSSAIGAVMTLIQGNRANMKTWTGDTETELEKYLLSLAHAGAPVVAWDNVLGTFDSATIATSVIEGRVSARQLGVTQALSPSFLAMWLASGNNGALGKDCSTRFYQARIAADAQAHRRTFPYEPSEAARADRDGIVRAIITVHRAWHEAGRPQADSITTRFPEHGRTVRQMVLWLSSSGLADEAGIGTLGDPADAILNRVEDSDPDAEHTTALFVALWDMFGTSIAGFTAGDVTTAIRDGHDSFDDQKRNLWSAVQGYPSRSARGHTPQSISALLKFRKDRTYAGLKLVTLPKVSTREAGRQGQRFAVVDVAQP